jgi:hypothetical protein
MYREEIGDVKFYILIDEAEDESKMEKITIILRFVDKDGFIVEWFFPILHVKGTIARNFKNGIMCCPFFVTTSKLRIFEVRELMDVVICVERNELEALFLRDCPWAYYVHFLAHKLQLALVVASKEAKYVNKFFIHLIFYYQYYYWLL